MSPERKRFPEWAGRERESDLHWIRENLPIFAQAAKVAYESVGRGVVVVDTAAQSIARCGELLFLGHPETEDIFSGYGLTMTGNL